MKDTILKDLKRTLVSLGFKDIDPVCYITENPQFGDYTSNVALQLANQKLKNDKQSGFEIANQILEKFGHPPYLERIEIAGPGFINFYLKDETLIKNLTEKPTEKKSPEKVLVEFAHPNTHKAFHIGHFRNISTGESISRLLEYLGKEVFRATYGGDIGLHVAKAIWGIRKLDKEYQEAKDLSLREKAEFLGKAYALGASQYEDSSDAKSEIDEVNKRLYAKDSELVPLWEETKQWSIAYFDTIYSRVGTEFDAQIWESDIEEEGKRVVLENLGKVFKEDQGAIIFPGEDYGLHTRVFITSAGNPTYEAKEIGLTQKEEELFPFDRSLHIVASEQSGYFKVLIKVLDLLEKKRIGKKHHISYGMVNLSTGKMSSRKGEVITAENLIDQVKVEIAKITSLSDLPSQNKVIDQIAIGAIKFSFLKYSLTSDIAFNIEESVSLQGDSGPYIQYSYARTKSVLSKSKKQTFEIGKPRLNHEERGLLRMLEYFDLVVTSAAIDLKPNELCEYLLNLAKTFNLFYQKHPILASHQEDFRLLLTQRVGDTLKMGLYLLGIEAPERM